MKKEIVEALAAATFVVNEWLHQHHPRLSLQLEDADSIKSTVTSFLRGVRGRKVGWSWETLYYKRVRGRRAWLFSLHRGEQAVAMCLGTISIAEDHVALEYLERRPYAYGVRGVPLAAA